MSRLSYKTLFIILFFLLIPIVFLLKINHSPTKTLAAWWNDSWMYRQAMNITVSNSATDITNLDTLITIDTSTLIAAGKMQNTCADLRFTNVIGDVLPYYIDSGCNTTTTKIWIQVDSVPKNTTNYTAYVYYGNSTATAASDAKTFNLYNGLVGYWNFNDNIGTSASDSSVKNNPFIFGSGNSAPSWLTSGKYGIGASFDGSNDIASVGISGLNSAIGTYNSVSFWMYWNGVTNKIPLDFGNYYDFWLNSSTCAGFNTAASDAYGFDPTSLSLSGRWAHIVLNFYNGVYTNNNEIYVDGVKQTLTQCSGSAHSGYISASTNFYLGSFNPGQGYPFGGGIDDVRIYNRALSASEVSQLYSNPASIASAGTQSKPTISFSPEETGGAPIAWWKFDEGVGTTAYDSTSNNNNIGFSGSIFPTWSSSENCISGNCVRLIGATNAQSQMILKNSGKLNFNNGAFSISMWFKGNSFSTPDAPELFEQPISGGGWINLRIAYNNELEFQVKGAGGTDVEINSPNNYIQENKWYYLVAIYDPTGTTKMYINGQQMPNTSTTNAGDLTKISDTRIGYGFNGWGWNGFIDDLKIYPYTRSSVQIAQDYATGKSGQSSSKGSNTSFGSSSSNFLSDGLVGYWKFDEGTGTTSADSSGNSNIATFGTGTSAPSWGNGKFGVGISFNSSNNNYIDSGSAPALTPSSAITLSAWVKASGTQNLYTGLIDNQSGNYGYSFRYNSANKFNSRFGNGSTTQDVTSVGSTPDGIWTHVVLTFDGKQFIYYFNGVAETPIPATITSIAANTNHLLLGSDYLSASRYFNGSLDEVRIYNRALSSAEVSALYNYAPGPVGYWNFDEGQGTIAKDISGNGNNATLLNGADFGIGKYGKALRLNIGVTANQYATISTINHNYSFTKEAWIYPTSITGCGSENRCSVIGQYFEVLSNLQYYDNNLSPNGWHSRGTIPLNQWSHIAVSYSNDNSILSLYINGISVGTTTAFQSNTKTHSSNIIGAQNNNSRNFRGYIDDVKIYNYARSQEQILQDMQGAGSAVNSAKIAGPIAWYKFDEGQGAIAHNSGSIGSTLNATLGPGTSTPTWTTGKNNKALSFNGSTNYVDMGNLTNTNFDTVSFSFWIRPSSTPVTSGYILDKNAQTYAMDLTPANKVRFILNGAKILVSNTTIANNSWTFISATYDKNIMNIYINGTLDNSTSYTTSLTYGGNALMIGKPTNTSNYFFPGLIDDVKIYNYALSSDEIKNDYNSGSSVAFGVTNLTVGNTSNSALYCVPGSTDYCVAPVAEWKFEEGTGTTAYDTSGNGNNGQIYNSPIWSPGKIGKSLKLNGSNTYIGVTDSPTLQLTSSGTVETWIKPISYPSASNWGVILNKGNWGAGYNDYAIYYSHANNLIFEVRGASANAVISTTNTLTPLNQWTHLSMSWDGSTVKTYINGIGGSQATMTQNPNTSGWNFSIGGINGGYIINGSIDQTRIYNYARTPAQIAWDYDQGAPIGWWKLDECQGSIAHDSSGLGNTGAIVIGASGTQNSLGTCQVGTSAAWTNGASGKINSSLNFDGTDDYVDITNPLADYPVSASMWLKPTTINGTNIAINLYLASGKWLTGGFYGSEGFITNTANVNAGPSYFTANQWQHVVIVMTSSTTGSIYVNGKLVNKSSGQYWSQAGTISEISGRNHANLFSGQIDDVRIYNYALTSEQVKQIYNGGAINFN